MIELAYESAHLAIAKKPSGIATTAPDGGDSLTTRLEAQLGVKLHPTSRLDAEVSGLVTFAKTKDAIHALKQARERGAYFREYLGLAVVAPTPREGVWDASIAIDPRDRRLRIAVPEGGSGERLQRARTRYEVLEEFLGGAALALFPETGRTHQLRVHAANAGAPLLGDVRYGGPRRVTLDDGRVVRAARVMLHCRRLRLPNVEGGELDLVEPPPPDVFKVWRSLGGSPR
ncbi:MAG: RNA pseudouridine synthase [Sandaracinaceae bacterium]|nr:RNA pseudouridine synthase [Sandaracinaceae bacterium]